VKWIHLTLERRKRRAIVSTVMNTVCDFHKTQGNQFAEKLLLARVERINLLQSTSKTLLP